MSIVPHRTTGAILALMPFACVILVYAAMTGVHATGASGNKLLPTLAEMFDTITRYALVPEKRTGKLLLWSDTAASLTRLAVAIAIASSSTLILGIALGTIPVIRSSFGAFIAALSMIPPMAVLPILFLTFGLGEASKIALIVIGITPFLVRDLSFMLAAAPHEQIIKAQSLGASTLHYILRIAIPQALPRLIDGLRLAIGPAFLFLISAEAIASEEGLGYRIFLVRRFLAMDVILPYVVWITIIAFVLDLALKYVSARLAPWNVQREG